MIANVDTGVVHMEDIKTLTEISEETGIKSCLLEHNIRMLKRRKQFIAGVDYINTRLIDEKYTPVGIAKITKGRIDDDRIRFKTVHKRK